MSDVFATHLRNLWRRYRRRYRDLEAARTALDTAVAHALAEGWRQADIAHLVGATRQEIQESVRRQRRRKRGETP